MKKSHESGFDWILALIAFLAMSDHKSHQEALERQRAEIKPFWWESHKS